MLYTLLYSSSGEWKRERGWMLRFLADGMRSTEDWKVLKRRHTWDLLASLFQSVAEDRTLRLSILEVLVNASADKHAATSLLLNSSILSWVYMQLGSVLTGEPLAYLKIIENLTIVVDHDQIEKATAGHWRDTAAQIVYKIVQAHGSDTDLVYLASRILLRLTTVLGTAPQTFIEPMRAIVQFLRSYEPSLTPLSFGLDGLAGLDPDHLHTNRDLLHPMQGAMYIRWSSSVRALWRVVVIMERVHPDIWEVLNSRMLLLAAMDVRGSQETEWTRHRLVEILVAP
ncbi:hypothetical protein FS749_002209 [Ceratobasidium sp. UAMH 11750]|nr:hypothetical protein FS749_002209 [Ceratobasidium sp. UAMH 11750]